MTISSTARVHTDRPGRYAKQLAGHFSRKIETRWDSDEGRGHLSFDREELRGEVDMIAGDGVLLLQLESAPESLDRLEAVVGKHLVRFATRDELIVEFKRPGGMVGSVWRSETTEA